MQAEKNEVLKRLAYIEGHLSGIRRMVEEDKYCVEILKQTLAIRKAIDKLDALLVSGHLNGCVRTGVRKGGAREEEIIRELNEIFDLSRR